MRCYFLPCDVLVMIEKKISKKLLLLALRDNII